MRDLVTRKPQDPTAWQLYRQEHPDRGIGSYILLNLCLMGAILGTIYFIQNITAFMGVVLFLACIYGFKGLK